MAPPSKMERVPPESLNNLPERVGYLKRFLKFSEGDGDAIQASAKFIAPLLPTVLDVVYGNLLSFDISAKAFAPRQPGYDGLVPDGPAGLSVDHPQILFRKDFLMSYFVKLVSNSDWSDESKFWAYLDKVGIIHTGETHKNLRVEFVHMNALLGFVEDIVINAVLDIPAEELDLATKKAVIRAFNKLLWIQNDLFARHYVVDKESGYAPKGWQHVA